MNVANHEISIVGRLVKVAKLRDEWYDFVERPAELIAALKRSNTRADLFTFLQEPHELEPKHPFRFEFDTISVLPISTYDHWWGKQINDKTRNMVRKASKLGVKLRATTCSDDFVRGVVEIYNESPTRQGKRFWHYGEDFTAIRQQLITFSDRSHFVGAFYGDELVGFFKLTENNGSASLMQIISKIAHRDKAPSNALIAKAVEMCAEKNIPYLQYAIWSSGGLGEFKVKHGFTCFCVPRYFVPLTLFGRLALPLKLHRDPARLVPEKIMTRLRSLRSSWHSLRSK